MVQNFILSTGSDSLTVASNNSSQFINWLTEKFKQPVEVGSSTVKGIINKFDATEHDGVIFRGDLLEWLWENQGKTVSLEIK